MKTPITLIVAELVTLSLISVLATYGVVNATEAYSESIGSEQQMILPASGENVNWQVISSGGTEGSSANYDLAGTIGQTSVSSGSSESFNLSHGFWQNFNSGPDYICGDVDGTGAVDIDDVVYLIAYIFSGGPAPSPLESADADCSGGIDIDDVVYLIAYIFSGGSAPCDTNGDDVPDC